MILHRLNRGISLIALLVSLSILSGLLLTLSTWTTQQRQSAVKIYQDFQGIQIAENQWQRLWLGLDCQSEQWQNHLHFTIRCQGQQIIVSYPLGETKLAAPSSQSTR
ncbi:prepilin peptidase dependent protein C [Volucribacter psittacicida]|uniref:Prepilin peptidase dependent protein C n=1 Tax=Volucribacter psittacicida TaxID=203482 RepID=A0A4R1FYN9_9PAST|nr:DUF5374 domain-containing protein [Volucribacter psittacicida]TCJ97948.1 prepilin peptidase dependent protein C [Volucribacter psittacicida]